jgi:hypothetical protein
MSLSPRLALGLALGLGASSLAAQGPARVQEISAAQTEQGIEIHIRTSSPVVPQSQAIAGPDRIALDFPGALPAAGLRPLMISRGSVAGARAGLFSNNPPVTRVVLDLSAPQSYAVFMDGNTVVVKVKPLSTSASATGGAALLSAKQVTTSAPPPKPLVEVTYRRGLLRIMAEKATLAQVLFEVHQQTGMEIAIPAGAEQEQVVADLGPGPTRDVLAALLNGSRYNFIFVGNDHDHTIQKAILSVR